MKGTSGAGRRRSTSRVSLSVDGSGILTTAPGSTIEISGDLLGTTQNDDDFNPQGTVELDSGTGTSNPPQELEAMSADLGAAQAGFVNNFAYGTISLTSDTSVELVDLSHNTTQHQPRGRLCQRADRAERRHPQSEQPAHLRAR